MSRRRACGSLRQGETLYPLWQSVGTWQAKNKSTKPPTVFVVASSVVWPNPHDPDPACHSEVRAHAPRRRVRCQIVCGTKPGLDIGG